MPTAARISAVSTAILALSLGLAPTASADPGERIVSYDVTVAIATNGEAHVTETIAYDFGTNQRHGITRTVAGRKLAGTATASSPDGAPAEVTKSGNTIRVGDPDTTVTGVHTYVLDYDIGSAVSLAGSTATVNWEIVDGSWDVPVAAMTGRITAPADTVLSRCVSGTTSCGSAVADGNVIRIQHKDLSAHASVRVSATFPSAGLSLTTPSSTYTYSAPAYTATRETGSSSRASGASAFGWLLGLGVVGLLIALFTAAGRSGKARRPRSGRGHYSNDTYYSSGGYYSSGDSSSSSSSFSDSSGSFSDSGGSSSSSSDSGSSSSGSW